MDWIVEALEHVRERGARNLTDGDGRIAELLKLARRVAPVRSAGKAADEVISELLVDAIAIEAITTRYSPAERTVLLAGFGASGSYDDTDSVGKREERAATSVGIEYHTYRKQPARKRRLADMARAILDLAAIHEHALVTAPTVPESFVPRPGPEQRFRELLRSGVRVIAFAGPPSVGKRTLARYLTAELKPAGTLVVRLIGSSQEALQHSMIDELRRLGMEEINFDVPRYSLRTLLQLPARPCYVLIEEAQDTELALFLAAVKTDTKIVLTTTRHLLGIEHVEVGELKPDEAVDLVSRVLPGTPAADATALAEDLGHHVLALLVAAGMIAEDGAEVPEFRRGLRRTIAALLDTAGEFPALTGLYRQVLDRLAPDARVALELMVYLDPSPVPTAFVVHGLAEYRGCPGANPVHLRVLARAALRALRDHYLITVVDDQVTVPSLTRSLVIGMTHDRGARIADHARAGALAVARFIRADHPDMPLLEFVRMCSPIINHVRATRLDPWKTGGSLAEHVYHYAQALGRFLVAIDEPRWRLVVVALQTSESGFSLILFPLPEAADEVENLGIGVGYANPDPREFWLSAPGWRDRKRILAMVVSQTLDLEELVTESAADD